MGFVFNNHTQFYDYLNDLKPIARVNNVKLFVLTQASDIRAKDIQVKDMPFKPTNTKVLKESNFGFNLSTALPIYISLFVSENDEPPTVLLKSARIPPGKNKQIDANGLPYIYHMQPDQTDLKFCIIHQKNADALQKLVRNIQKEWSSIPDIQCKRVHS